MARSAWSLFTVGLHTGTDITRGPGSVWAVRVCVYSPALPGSSRLIIALLLSTSARHTWALVTIIMGPRSPVTTLTIGHTVTWISASIIIIPNTPGVTGNREQRQGRGLSDIIIYESQTSFDTRSSQHCPAAPTVGHSHNIFSMFPHIRPGSVYVSRVWHQNSFYLKQDQKS